LKKKAWHPTSAIPKGSEKPVDRKRSVCLVVAVELLMKHLTSSLCRTVFEDLKDRQRERKWTFTAVVQFWVAMGIANPPSIGHGVAQARVRQKRDALWPYVQATTQALLQKCQRLRPDFFKALYEAFLASLWPEMPEAYASGMKGLRKHFPEILVVDGSRLDAIAHRLKLLWSVRARVLPGCLTVFYDLFRGIPRGVLFYPNAAQAELPRAQDVLEAITRGALLLGDRLYASVQYFHLLTQHQLYGLFRKNGTLKIKRLEVLSRKEGRGFLEDVLVQVGSGQKHPAVTLRLIRFYAQGRRLELLTNVLDPKTLSAKDAIALYGLRWSIERMFLDLKETLHLHSLYASHPNLVAQQVYATALIYTAFRVAQAKIAVQARVLPEQLSPGKLFPKLADVTQRYAEAKWMMLETKALNPRKRIAFPDLRDIPRGRVRLGSIVAQHRKTLRKKKRFCASAKRWKSFAHIRGGPTLLKTATVG
jgi:hypothetical protein